MSHVFMLMTILFVTLLDYRGPLYDHIATLSGPSFSLPSDLIRSRVPRCGRYTPYCWVQNRGRYRAAGGQAATRRPKLRVERRPFLAPEAVIFGVDFTGPYILGVINRNTEPRAQRYQDSVIS